MSLTKSAVPPSAAQDDWAICCSGGGIRSATYCLGALQNLDAGGLLSRARWILGVSGGSYIAASRALVAHGLRQQARSGRAGSGQSGRPGLGVPPPAAYNGRSGDGQACGPRPYARGTPEETNLRNNTHYIAPDAKTVLVGVFSLLLGALAAFLIVTAPLYALGHVWGWVLRDQGVLSWPSGGPPGAVSASVTSWTWWITPAAAGVGTLGLFAWWWFTLPVCSPDRGSERARWVGWAAAITTALALLMLVVPLLVSWLYRSTGAIGTIVHFFGLGGPGHWSLASFAALIAAVTAVAHDCQRQLAKIKVAPGVGTNAAGPVGQAVSLLRGRIMTWLASAVIVLAGAAVTILWVGNGAYGRYTAAHLVAVAAALAVMAATRAVVDINRISLHDFYRWRLADAYAVTRQAAQARFAERRALFATAARTKLSDLRADDGEPKLVIGATANINANRDVAPGRGGYCLAFDPDCVILRSDPLNGQEEAKVDTTDYEDLLGHTRFTLFDVVAMSGGAFSPLMGAATRPAYRILLTLTNMRLGVWLPHPAVVAAAREYLEGGADTRVPDRAWTHWTWLLLLWYAMPHPFSRGYRAHRHTQAAQSEPGTAATTAKRRKVTPATLLQREARLWAHVLELRKQSAHGKSRWADLRAAVCWHLMQPTLGMLWAEAAGHTSYRATWVNVTDGGHYDNLGLVEALRRGARNIVVLDASGDQTGTWFTLGGAIALARVDAGTEISLDPTVMTFPAGSTAPAQGLHRGEVLQPWACGTFTTTGAAGSSDGVAGPGDGVAGPGDGVAGPDDDEPVRGRIWVCKLGWWRGAPWDVRAYAAGHASFPCESTLQQLYDSSEFDSYHELGASAVSAAARDGHLPLASWGDGGAAAEYDSAATAHGGATMPRYSLGSPAAASEGTVTSVARADAPA